MFKFSKNMFLILYAFFAISCVNCDDFDTKVKLLNLISPGHLEKVLKEESPESTINNNIYRTSFGRAYKSKYKPGYSQYPPYFPYGIKDKVADQEGYDGSFEEKEDNPLPLSFDRTSFSSEKEGLPNINKNGKFLPWLDVPAKNNVIEKDQNIQSEEKKGFYADTEDSSSSEERDVNEERSDNITPSSTLPANKFVHNHGFVHNHDHIPGFYPHFHHNHGFYQPHNPDCYFPYGRGRRPPPRRIPVTTTTAASVDPRQSTPAGIVKNWPPKIDIRYGRDTRDKGEEAKIVFPDD